MQYLIIFIPKYSIPIFLIIFKLPLKFIPIDHFQCTLTMFHIIFKCTSITSFLSLLSSFHYLTLLEITLKFSVFDRSLPLPVWYPLTKFPKIKIKLVGMQLAITMWWQLIIQLANIISPISKYLIIFFFGEHDHSSSCKCSTYEILVVLFALI
jgi:hypothetical protein